MVQSNKKLKQKLRAAKAELLASSEVKQEEGSMNEKTKQKQKKRKRDETDGLDKDKGELGKPMKKKKKKKNKGKKKVEDGQVVEGMNVGDGGNGQVASAAHTSKTEEREESVDISNKVYVGGIPYYSTEDDIRSYFEGCGTITEVDCMNFPDSGKFRGIAIITFKTEAAAKRAMALDGSDMGGLFLKIQSYKSAKANKVSNFSPNMVEGYNRVYVGNLSWNVTEDDLKNVFSDCSISSIRFGEDKETGEFRGYAHVDFSDSVSVNMALKLDQKIVCGRPVRISCAVAKEGAVKKGGATDSRPMLKDQNVDSVATSTVSAKIRRRTCYECGERGHLSSSCPKKQETDQKEQVAS
ncbi:hypothetical protein H5410_031185 [Solanum commersonii]|uniref:Protein gar2 n=1 Tax=Solanum commersonii TaxID=4109 RepID=A0A9J5YJ66_SOLCO|nr:hypothetical protein H5410_031185 [Solanum commersonii]